MVAATEATGVVAGIVATAVVRCLVVFRAVAAHLRASVVLRADSGGLQVGSGDLQAVLAGPQEDLVGLRLVSVAVSEGLRAVIGAAVSAR